MSNESPSPWVSSDALNQAETVVKNVRSFWTGFVAFALRDNVLEVAVGLM